MIDCPHVESDALACLECRLATIDWIKIPASYRELIKLTVEDFPPNRKEDNDLTTNRII